VQIDERAQKVCILLGAALLTSLSSQAQWKTLFELVRNHLPPLRAEGLVTDRTSIIMRCADGTIVEVLEWVSQEIIVAAHKNPVVLDLWKKFEAVCWYETPANLPEFQNMFAHFEPI
jgi:hypothetical protein